MAKIDYAGLATVIRGVLSEEPELRHTLSVKVADLLADKDKTFPRELFLVAADA